MPADGSGRRVFVYGSLLSEPSLLQTLPHRTTAPTATPFVLAGWQRSWNVVSARSFALADDPSGAVHRRLVLGLAPQQGARCEGVVLDLTADDLAALALREAAYELTVLDAGGSGDTDGGADPVWTYLPRSHRTVGHGSVVEPLVVEAAYLSECRAGLAHHDLTEAAADLDRSLDGLRIADAAPPPAADQRFA